MPNVREASTVGKIGAKRCHSAKKAVFAGMARSYSRSGPCPRHATPDFDGTLHLVLAWWTFANASSRTTRKAPMADAGRPTGATSLFALKSSRLNSNRLTSKTVTYKSIFKTSGRVDHSFGTMAARSESKERKKMSHISKVVTVTTLMRMKANGEKIVALTAYDYPFACLVEDAGLHIILVGDSLGMAVQGLTSTLPVTMDEMLYHTRIVAHGVEHAMVLGDMPFMSYQTSISDAVYNAGRFLKEAGAAGVKLEGGATVCDRIRAITEAGIPVQAHIGLTPQSVHQMGGFRVQRDEERLLADAVAVEAAGAFSVVLEGIPAPIAAKITAQLKIPTIGIGAGPDCDGQVLVLHDLLGLNDRHRPKFVKQYARLGDLAREALRQYAEEVQNGTFPGPEHCY